MSISLLLVGAGGELGQILLQELIRQKSAFGTIAVLAATKEKAATYASAESQGIKVVIGSFLHASSYTGFTHVVSALGAAAMRLQPAMIDAAVAGGIRNFFPSEYNSDISQKAIYTMRYFRDKHVTRTHLRLKAKEVPGFTYTILVTGVFTEWAVLEFYGFDHAKGLVEAYGRPDARASVTSIPDIARFTVSSLLLPFEPTTASGSERTIRVQGASATFEELVDALGVARGVKYLARYVDPAEAAVKEEEARLDGDDAGEMAWSVRPLIASGFAVADPEGTKLDNALFDFTPETIAETLSRVYG